MLHVQLDRAGAVSNLSPESKRMPLRDLDIPFRVVLTPTPHPREFRDRTHVEGTHNAGVKPVSA
jgi:hypothetical protein